MALHNAIMEAGSKIVHNVARLIYGSWNLEFKRYIDTKPNSELIYYCLQNPPYTYQWAEKTVPVAEGIDNDIYSIVDACPNACKMWKAIERLKQGESINVQDLETNFYSCQKSVSCYKSSSECLVLTSTTTRMAKRHGYVNQRAVIIAGLGKIRLLRCAKVWDSMYNERNLGMYQGMSESEMSKGCSLSQER
ncbi:hypothetical protein Tco_0333066 [Tanacetum coccineum]